MKILWLSNIILPVIAENLSKEIGTSCGWIIGLFNSVIGESNIELAICFPLKGNNLVAGRVGSLKYYGFTKEFNNSTKYSKKVENQMKTIIKDYNPDIVHIFGTEFPHALSMVRAFNNPNLSIISIQGLCSYIAKHYYAGLPYHVLKKYTIRDILTRNNIVNQKSKFLKRGDYEIEAIRNVNHIIGRTEWDKACTKQINPHANYYCLNESLRDVFYKKEWNIEKCDKHSIFLSQGNYSIKGLHFIVEAMVEIIRTYPNAHLYIAGTNIIKNDTIIDKLKRTSYSVYIEKLIRKCKLTTNITFTGKLTDDEMSDRYLKSHVYVSTSSIENSPNSLGEAMILGVPSISSDVGGVKSLITHNLEGFLYQYDAPYILAYYVSKIFEDDNLAVSLSNNAKNRAKKTHNRKENTDKLIEIYKTVAIGAGFAVQKKAKIIVPS